jgi:cobalt-zinc-cadmium efflux system membrane fusion protein
VIRAPVTLAVAAVIVLTACAKHEASATEAQPGGASESVASAASDAGGTDGAPKLCEHGVPADQCTKCSPELAAVFKEMGDWCEHDLPESHCKQCNPTLTFVAATPKDWCKEHAVPESKCTKCNPKLVPKFIAAGDYCREHGYPESVCPRCHPELVRAAGGEPPLFPPPGTRVRIASDQALRAAGIQTVKAEARPVARTIEAVGRLVYDQNRFAQLTPRGGDALVVEVKVDVGDEVKVGQPLVVLTSGAVGGNQAQLAAAKARVEAARAAFAREEALVQRGISARKDLEEARRDLAAAEAEQDAARAALAASGGGKGTGGRYVLTAPFAGTVVARDAVAGRTVADDQVLLELADLSKMWANLEVPEGDAASVRPGQRVRIEIEALRGATRQGTIARVGSSVDPATRTIRARVELPNEDRSLKSGLLLRAAIDVSDAHDAVLVPRDAVQHAEGHSLVFVRTGKGIFDPVAVELAESTGDAVAVKGIDPGAEVVTTGAFLLKTEILKDSIGAGCCETDAPKGSK